MLSGQRVVCASECVCAVCARELIGVILWYETQHVEINIKNHLHKTSQLSLHPTSVSPRYQCALCPCSARVRVYARM